MTLLDVYDWNTGEPQRAAISLTYRLGELFGRLSEAQSIEFAGYGTIGDAFKLVFVVVAVLFLIIELVALVMGLALARSITSSIHELFMGTERVRQGDFTHRISVCDEGSARRAGGVVQPDDRQHREPAADGGREEAHGRRAAHRASDPDVAAAARPARHAGSRRDGAVRPGARGGRGLLRLLPARPRPAGRAHRRRRRERARRRRSTWRSSRAWCCRSARSIRARAAPDRSEPDPVGKPRQPQLHHDDLCRHRPRAMA